MAIIVAKHYITVCVIINLIVLQAVMAQRPFFAGSRPVDGLNQKDKYHTTTAASSSADIQNRFGSAGAAPISNQLPFGQPQKPPVGIVVTPESSFVKLEASTNTVSFQDRFGETDSNGINSRPVIPTATPAPGHPFDAHGDQQLIDQLSKLPIDQRPFWFINYQAIEALRNGSASNFATAQASRGSFSG